MRIRRGFLVLFDVDIVARKMGALATESPPLVMIAPYVPGVGLVEDQLTHLEQRWRESPNDRCCARSCRHLTACV